MATTRKPRTTRAGGPDVYTYRGGRKLTLEKEPDEFVVRATGESATATGVRSAVRISSSSTRVKVPRGELEAKMAASRKLAPTHHAYKLADTGSEFLVTDRVLLRFKPATTAAQIDALAGKYALVMQERFSELEFMFQLTDDTGMNPLKLVVALTEDEPIVELADNDLNQRMQRQQFTPPTDTHYLRAWHLHQRFMHADVDPRSSSHCEQAWQLFDGFGSPDVVIAITDDGCRLDHGDFNDNKFAGWGYFKGSRLVTSADPDALASNMYQSGSNHGTSCAGVAAGEADGVLTVGAAPGCRLLPVKWESDESSLFVSDSKLRRVLDWIADKADVMSNSWGIVPDNLFASLVTDRIAQLSNSGGRRGRGIVFLWAAGNEDCPIEHDGNIAIPYTDGWQYNASGTRSWVGVRTARRFRNTLVGLPGVMHIAALASTAQRSHYSNHGFGIDLCAPSSNSHAFWRMGVAGLGIVAPTGEGQRYSLGFGGTSSATPLVAGIAALAISANPLLSAAEVISILQRTASKDLDLTPYRPTPPAAFDPQPTWDVSPAGPYAQGAFTHRGDADGSWSPWFGFGKVDAQRVVAEAIARRTAPAPVPTPGSGYSAQSSRVIAIPDVDTNGIEDRLALTGVGEVGSIALQVDIAHPYIGDLSVSLTSPDGTTAVTHNRSGANQRDLARTWTIADTPALAALIGKKVAGDWRLRVRDLASADVGKLRKWSLLVGPRMASSVALSENPGLTIPDNRASGLTRTLVSDLTGPITELTIEVDITHPYIGDLIVALTAPSGRRIVLHNREGRGADNLIRSWNTSTAAQLSPLIGENAKGTWKLEVADRDAADIGKLNRWRIALTAGATLANPAARRTTAANKQEMQV